MQHNLLEILEYFSIWNISLKKKGKSDNFFSPNQTWKIIQSLILELVDCIQFYVIESGEVFFQDEQILIQLSIILAIQDKVLVVEMHQ